MTKPVAKCDMEEKFEFFSEVGFDLRDSVDWDWKLFFNFNIGKLTLFHLLFQRFLVLLISKWMGLSLKIQRLFIDCLEIVSSNCFG